MTYALSINHTISLIAEAQLVQRYSQPLIAQMTAALINSGLLISKPVSAMSAGVAAQLSLSALLASRPANVLSEVSFSALLTTTASKLEYVHMTYLSSAADITLSLRALLGMKNQKVILCASLESSLSAAEAAYKPPSGLSATMEALLSASLLIDIRSGHALQAGLQAALTTSALLEMEAIITWEYPVQTGTDLYIRQVYGATQTGNTLHLE